MDIDTHKLSENPRTNPTDPIGAELEHAQAHGSIPPAKTPATGRSVFVMPSADAIAEAIIRRASADLRG